MVYFKYRFGPGPSSVRSRSGKMPSRDLANSLGGSLEAIKSPIPDKGLDPYVQTKIEYRIGPSKVGENASKIREKLIQTYSAFLGPTSIGIIRSPWVCAYYSLYPESDMFYENSANMCEAWITAPNVKQ